MYADLVARTGNPEFMDALARLLRARGEEARAQAWIAAARRVHEQRLALFPEASWGHALGHFLDFGEPEIAVTLAEMNWRLRPNREAAQLLEAAYARAGRPRPAP
jgi:Xaa-Pro aminopeptidase